MEINWVVVGPMVLTVLTNVCAFFYVFGVQNQKLRNVDVDIARIREEVEKLQKDGKDTDRRIQDMALLLMKVSTQMDHLVIGGCDTSDCPFTRRVRTAAGIEHEP